MHLRIFAAFDSCDHRFLRYARLFQDLGGRGHIIRHGASANDPLVVLAVVLTMLATGVLSASLPARRALAIEPASLLREE